jgi:hypothetical protein
VFVGEGGADLVGLFGVALCLGDFFVGNRIGYEGN